MSGSGERRERHPSGAAWHVSSGGGVRGSTAMAALLVSSAVLAAKGRTRVSKHTPDELAQLGGDAQDSGSEASACSSGE